MADEHRQDVASLAERFSALETVVGQTVETVKALAETVERHSIQVWERVDAMRDENAKQRATNWPLLVSVFMAAIGLTAMLGSFGTMYVDNQVEPYTIQLENQKEDIDELKEWKHRSDVRAEQFMYDHILKHSNVSKGKN